MKYRNDITGIEVRVGDYVIYAVSGRGLKFGHVRGFGSKCVMVHGVTGRKEHLYGTALSYPNEALGRLNDCSRLFIIDKRALPEGILEMLDAGPMKYDEAEKRYGSRWIRREDE